MVIVMNYIFAPSKKYNLKLDSVVIIGYEIAVVDKGVC